MRKIYVLFLMLTMSIAFTQVSIESDSIKSQKRATDKNSTSNYRYDSWAISAYAGTSLIQAGDLTSIHNGVGDWNFGYDFQLGIFKSLNHTVSLGIQAQLGETKQENQKLDYTGHTKYLGLMFVTDVNLSNLLRRIDERKDFKWALHAFVGGGLVGYKAYADIPKSLSIYDPKSSSELLATDQDLDLGSFYSQVGLELKYKLNQNFDLSLRGAFYMTGDETFDGSGDPVPGYAYGKSISDVEEGRDDTFMTFNLGLTYKIGKHPEHVLWVDPLRELYMRIPAQIKTRPIPPVCAKGDNDLDGVCDDWDKCLDTPKGARIDGSGCPLDTDLDGVFDYEDKCVVVPGIRQDDPTKNGCPGISVENIEEQLTKVLEGIQFDLNKATLKPVSIPKLDNAADVIMNYAKDKNFIVEGHTDARGTDAANLLLSQRRVETVVKYLTGKGVSASQLKPVGVGERKLLNPECDPATNCVEQKNEANRRVVFLLDNGSYSAPEKPVSDNVVTPKAKKSTKKVAPKAKKKK